MIKETNFADITRIAELEKTFSGPAIYNFNQLEGIIKNPAYCNYSLFSNNVLIGYLISVITDTSVDLLKIYIDEACRQHGNAQSLLNELIQHHALHRAIYIEVEHTNTNAIAFYLKNGFTKIDEKKDYYAKNKTAIVMIRKPT
jgi:ribosomal-protein-alanine N-acetyltransferase